MQSYIEIKVPLRSNAQWIAELKRAFRIAGIKVAWKIPGHPHLTLAFIDETPDVDAVVKGVEPCLSKAKAPIIKYDRLNVFRAQSGTKYVINLTTSAVPEGFQCLVNNIRETLEQTGAVMRSKFLFHVTLGEVAVGNANITQIQNVISSVVLPDFSLTLRNVNFMEFRGKRTIFAKWMIANEIKEFTNL